MNMKKLLLISMMLMTVLAMAACEDSGDEPFTPEHPELSGPSGGEDENESEVPDVSSLQEVTKRVYFTGNERMLIAHDSNRLRFS